MPQRPNVLIVHCHDLGQHLHCYGVKTVVTPNIDAFAAAGVRFVNSFCTAPQCSPSRASMFTGRYPHNTGVMGICLAGEAWDLNPEERHLGQFFKDMGYATAAVGVIHETRSGAARCGLDEHLPISRAAGATDAAIQYLECFARRPDCPFYLQVGFTEPHRLSPPDPDADKGFLDGSLKPDTERGVQVPEYLQDTESAREEIAELQGAIRHVDVQFGRLLTALSNQGLQENTLVIFTADHGVGLPRAKCSLYDPGIEVAFILRLPSRGGWHGGRIVEPMISNIDYLPTLLSLLDLPVPDNVQGRSFALLLDGQPYVERDEVFAELTYHRYYDPRRCVRTQTHKLILNFSIAPFFMDPSQSWHPRTLTVAPPNPAHARHPPVELYDLREDPLELNNVSDKPKYARVRQELLTRLKGHLEQTDDPILRGPVPSPMHGQAAQVLMRG